MSDATKGDSAQMSVRALAKVLGVSPSTIQRDCPAPHPDADGMIEVDWTLGRDGKVRPSRRYDTSDRDDLIRSLRADGHSIRSIAEQADCSVGTVHRVLKATPPKPRRKPR
jgi:IS30 family transposase